MRTRVAFIMGAFLLSLPLLVSAQSTCNPSPHACPTGQTQYYAPSSASCPQGNYYCAGTAGSSVTSSVTTSAAIPATSSAASRAALIASLLAQIKQLQALLAQLLAQKAATLTARAPNTSTTAQQTVASPAPTLTPSTGSTGSPQRSSGQVRDLSLGSRGTDVETLQTFLITRNLLPSDSATGYFGRATQAAVQSYQSAAGIVSSGTPATTGYGAVGPRTRAVMAAGGTDTTTATNATTAENRTAPVVNTPNVSTSNTPSTLAPTLTAPPTMTSSPASCTFNGQTIAGGASVTAYQSSSVAYGGQCVSEQRTCTNGTLGGSYSYQYASCSVEVVASCTFNGQTVANGALVTAYQSSSVPAGSQCVSEQRTCTNGILSGSNQYASCSVGAATSCTFNNQTIANGSSVTAYQSSSVPAGSQCVSESRTCSNGTLSGSYTNAACSVGIVAGPTVLNGAFDPVAWMNTTKGAGSVDLRGEVWDEPTHTWKKDGVGIQNLMKMKADYTNNKVYFHKDDPTLDATGQTYSFDSSQVSLRTESVYTFGCPTNPPGGRCDTSADIRSDKFRLFVDTTDASAFVHGYLLSPRQVSNGFTTPSVQTFDTYYCNSFNELTSSTCTLYQKGVQLLTSVNFYSNYNIFNADGDKVEATPYGTPSDKTFDVMVITLEDGACNTQVAPGTARCTAVEHNVYGRIGNTYWGLVRWDDGLNVNGKYQLAERAVAYGWNTAYDPQFDGLKTRAMVDDAAHFTPTGSHAAAAIPTNLSAVCSVDGTHATFSWNPVSGATGYALRVNDTTNDASGCSTPTITGPSGTCVSPTDYVNDSATSPTTVSVPSGAPLSWWVHTVTSAGLGSPGTGTTITCTAAPKPPVLLLHGDGANNSTMVTDSGPNNHAMTANGNAKISTAQSKFGGASMSFDGTNSYVTTPDTPDLNFGSGDFTIDLWAYPTDVTNYRTLIAKSGGASFYGPFVIEQSQTMYTFFAASADGSWNMCAAVSMGPVTLNTWTHLALVRSGNTFSGYQNGVLQATCTASDSLWADGAPFSIGRLAPSATEYFNGYIDELRISNSARWTSNFTSPSAPYATSASRYANLANALTALESALQALMQMLGR